MIPKEAHFDLSCRYVPNEKIDKFFSRLYAYIRLQAKEMRKKDINSGIFITERNHVYPLNARDDCEIVKLTKFASNEEQTETVTYGSEAGYFQKMGIDTVICGPGDILTAHKPNEYVTIHDLTKFENFFINMKRFNQQKEKER